MTTESRLLTAGDLLRLHSQGVRGELIRGVLIARQPGGIESGAIIANFAMELGNFLNGKRVGRGAVGSGYWLERDPDTVREAQVAYISSERLPLHQRCTGYAEVAPDLVVEVQGFNREWLEVNDKARMWLSFGVRLVWVVRPRDRTVDVHRAGRSTESIGEDGDLGGLDVLPGFRCSVASIFGP